jgi:hypothetical protein
MFYVRFLYTYLCVRVSACIHTGKLTEYGYRNCRSKHINLNSVDGKEIKKHRTGK